MKIRALVLAAVVMWAGEATVAHAQFWEKKHWKTWSEGECEKILKDSPWARIFQTAIFAEGPSGLASGTRGLQGENRQEITYTVQLRSALPVRQAIIRLAMIENKYDKMAVEDQKAFDQRAEEYLDQSYENRVVAHVSYKSNHQEIERSLARIWQGREDGEIPLHGDMILSNGERIRPVRFMPSVGGSREFELVFPKEVQGKPYVNSNDRDLSIELPGVGLVLATLGGQQTERRARIQFDLRKMKYQGKLEY